MRKIASFFALISLLVFGSVQASDDIVSAYLVGKHMSVSDTSKALTSNGFKVLTEYKVGKKGKFTSIVFTSSDLAADATKPNRGFAAILRVLVDDERSLISVTNPRYFMKAFLQDDYNEKSVKATTDALKAAFGELSTSSDEGIAFDKLSDYHFMLAMPYYEDMEVVGKGKCTELVEKAKKYKGGKGLLFDMKLADDKYLVGYKLGNRTSKFPKKIGTQNSQVLPYVVLIEKGEAKILAPKYYLAIAYPLLTMSEFMKIATIPDAINKDLKKVFK
ncbi:MAG: hypothetical protein U9N42_00800 [Campylobacterota bacterium]|nr:hypothetical protein [Campylobacterota bacterium]